MPYSLGTTQNNARESRIVNVGEDMMVEHQFRASLSQSQGRPGWSITFRHPLVAGSEGRLGRRVRKGLGTTDRSEAEFLCAEMNTLLSSPRYLSLLARREAEMTFDQRVVDAFYNEVAPPIHDPWATREEIIPLPGADDGYAKVLLLGTTGAGKTTVVRQLLGTDPKSERFPSTSTARTTTAEMEIVLHEGPFRAVVTFLTRDRVRTYVEECVTAAATASLEGRSQQDVARKLLEHSDQRFRLSYILGTLPRHSVEIDDEDDDIEGSDAEDDALEIGVDERRRLADHLKGYLASVDSMTVLVRKELAESLGIDTDQTSVEDQDTLDSLFEEALQDRGEFVELVDEIVQDIRSRFDHLSDGTISRDVSDWPSHWSASIRDRSAFIQSVNRFSSNYAPLFGRLLTPLVQGVRVAGPFLPSWATEAEPKLVLLDREGLGHTTETASSVPTAITNRYDLVDAILLVDNSAQPMQAAPVTVIKSLVSSGHIDKLSIAFTHFDAVKGDNLPDSSAKRAHVRGALDLITADIGQRYGAGAARTLEHIRQDRTFFLAGINADLSERAQGTRRQFSDLVSTLMRSIEPSIPSEARPVYDDRLLDTFVRDAVQDFRGPWQARLGRGFHPEIAKQHWTRVKALSRRFASRMTDEYDGLRPVADLRERLGAEIRLFLSKPSGWESEHAPEDMQETAINAIAQEVTRQLSALVDKRLRWDPIQDWQIAYGRSGAGSTTKRAFDIEAIFEVAAPDPAKRFSAPAVDFQREMRQLVRDAIAEEGGLLVMRHDA